MLGFGAATGVLRVSLIGWLVCDVVWGMRSRGSSSGGGGGGGVGGGYYTEYWAVQVDGGTEVASRLAAKHGFVYRGQIMADYYHFQHRKVAKRSPLPSSHHHRNLVREPRVKWLEQQKAKKRVKRDIVFNDPKWPIMWYLNRGGGLDMNVKQAWQLGYTGKGVVVTILDDGIEKDHPDLQKNYDEYASYDVNGHDPDPQPRYDYSNENRHGTRCAGEVAAQADNHVCSVGVAFNARIGGVRMLDGDVTDSVEAQSLSLNTQHIHIYSASWGPDDDGRTVDGPATLARKAFYDGITKGRGGLGSIFVWASGNGGRDGDNCNCDGYTNSIYTLSISSSTENGNVPWYSEACSSTLATTYSSGSGGEKQIVTTDLRKDCTETHTGTSASAPLAAGLIALALQANPSMTWRDMQHIVVETAKPGNLNAPDWVVNGAGKNVSHSFGFGLMDAAAMVSLARNWTTVPQQHICEVRSKDQNRPVPMNGKLIVLLDTDGCQGTLNHVAFLEHVQARLTLTSSRRGEIQVSLTSPSLTRSVLLAKRTRDTSREGFNNWAFMTTHSWGEPARGQWVLEIENGASSAELKEWTLVVMGTEKHPRKQNVFTQTSAASHAFTCAGVTSNGICIECQAGFYKLDQNCVAHCPDHFYGSVQSVHLASPHLNSSTPLLHPQGVCKPCHPSCLTCRGGEPSDCVQCNSGYERQGDTGAACHKTLLWDLLDPAVMKHLAWAIILCIGALILFSIVFALLHARRRQRLCWASPKAGYVPDLRKGTYDGVSTEEEDPSLPKPPSSQPAANGAVRREPDFASPAVKATPSSLLAGGKPGSNGYSRVAVIGDPCNPGPGPGRGKGAALEEPLENGFLRRAGSRESGRSGKARSKGTAGPGDGFKPRYSRDASPGPDLLPTAYLRASCSEDAPRNGYHKRTASGDSTKNGYIKAAGYPKNGYSKESGLPRNGYHHHHHHHKRPELGEFRRNGFTPLKGAELCEIRRNGYGQGAGWVDYHKNGFPNGARLGEYHRYDFSLATDAADCHRYEYSVGAEVGHYCHLCDYANNGTCLGVHRAPVSKGDCLPAHHLQRDYSLDADLSPLGDYHKQDFTMGTDYYKQDFATGTDFHKQDFTTGTDYHKQDHSKGTELREYHKYRFSEGGNLETF